MIKIKTKKVNNKSGIDFMDNLTNASMNDALSLFKTSLEEKYKDSECSLHKEKSKGTILMYEKEIGELSFDLSDFCCDSFKESIEKSFK